MRRAHAPKSGRSLASGNRPRAVRLSSRTARTGHPQGASLDPIRVTPGEEPAAFLDALSVPPEQRGPGGSGWLRAKEARPPRGAPPCAWQLRRSSWQVGAPAHALDNTPFARRASLPPTAGALRSLRRPVRDVHGRAALRHRPARRRGCGGARARGRGDKNGLGGRGGAGREGGDVGAGRGAQTARAPGASWRPLCPCPARSPPCSDRFPGVLPSPFTGARLALRDDACSGVARGERRRLPQPPRRLPGLPRSEVRLSLVGVQRRHVLRAATRGALISEQGVHCARRRSLPEGSEGAATALSTFGTGPATSRNARGGDEAASRSGKGGKEVRAAHRRERRLIPRLSEVNAELVVTFPFERARRADPLAAAAARTGLNERCCFSILVSRWAGRRAPDDTRSASLTPQRADDFLSALEQLR